MAIFSEKIHLRSIIDKLILIMLFLTPLFSFQEFLALIYGGVVNNSTALTSPYIKGIKDLFFVSIVFSAILLILKIKKINIILLSMIAGIGFFVIIPAYYNHDNILIFFAGLRWFFPFVLALFLIGNVKQELLCKIGKILFWLFILHFSIQIIQLFISDPWFGITVFGLSARNPGIFFIPSTAAVFVILVLFFSKFYMSNKLSNNINLLIPVSILLTASGTGIVAYLVFTTVFHFNDKYSRIMPLFLLVLASFLIIYIDALSGRAGLLEDSFGQRIEMFEDVFNSATWLPSYFGYGTSTGYLIQNHYGFNFEMIPTDSWFASVVVNLGMLNFIAIILLVASTLFYLFIFRSKERLLFLLMYCLIGMTTVFTESYPVNLLFSVLLGYYLTTVNDLTRQKRYLMPDRKNQFK